MKQTQCNCLLGALAGDVIGSVYEYRRFKSTQFDLFSIESKFTDDSVLTLAVADAILRKQNYQDCIQEYARAYPNRGYGGHFAQWIFQEDPQPYNSYGNGSAMRVSAVGWAFETIDDVLHEAKASAEVTHNHPEGIKGAQAVALAIFLARKGTRKVLIRQEMINQFHYDLSHTLDEIRPGYHFNETCQETVPPALVAFLESTDFEDSIRKAVSLGGDADTLAAITGSIAEAFYGGVPQSIVEELQSRFPPELWDVVEAFNQKYCPK